MAFVNARVGAFRTPVAPQIIPLHLGGFSAPPPPPPKKPAQVISSFHLAATPPAPPAPFVNPLSPSYAAGVASGRFQRAAPAVGPYATPPPATPSYPDLMQPQPIPTVADVAAAGAVGGFAAPAAYDAGALDGSAVAANPVMAAAGAAGGVVDWLKRLTTNEKIAGGALVAGALFLITNKGKST